MIGLINIWGIFTVIFLVLSIWHWKRRNKRIAHFEVKERPLNQMPGVQVVAKIAGADVDMPIKEFADDFNEYLDDYNKTSREQHVLQAIGYGVASGTAIASMISIAI